MARLCSFTTGKTILSALREPADIPFERLLPARLHKPFAASLKLTFTRDGDKQIPITWGSSFNVIVTNTEKIRIRKPTVRNAAQSRLLAGTKDEEATAIANVTSVPQRGTPIWGQTSLYQVLLCPSNFHDFNDPVLRASLLRGADEQELNYVLDETSSAEMLALLQAELMAWVHGSGNSLPEFLLALSTRRLRLTHGHATELRTSIANAKLPDYPGVLAEKFLNAQ